jgi:hypothetical protein
MPLSRNARTHNTFFLHQHHLTDLMIRPSFVHWIATTIAFFNSLLI